MSANKLPPITPMEKYHIENLEAIDIGWYSSLSMCPDFEDYYMNIKDKTERVNRVAVGRMSEILQFIDDQSYKVQIIGLKNSYLCIKHIKNPSYNIYHYVANKLPMYISQLPDVPDWAYKQALDKHTRVMEAIMNPSYAIQEYFINKYYKADIKGIKETPLKYINSADISPKVRDLIDFYEL